MVAGGAPGVGWGPTIAHGQGTLMGSGYLPVRSSLPVSFSVEPAASVLLHCISVPFGVGDGNDNDMGIFAAVAIILLLLLLQYMPNARSSSVGKCAMIDKQRSGDFLFLFFMSGYTIYWTPARVDSYSTNRRELLSGGVILV